MNVLDVCFIAVHAMPGIGGAYGKGLSSVGTGLDFSSVHEMPLRINRTYALGVVGTWLYQIRASAGPVEDMSVY